MKLSQTTAYAFHAVLRLAGTAEASPISCSKLAELGKMPERFLLQILRDLGKNGILESTRGSNGGFMLAGRSDEISLLEVIEAIEGPIVATLPLKRDFPDPAGERLHDVLRKVTENVRGELQAGQLDRCPQAAFLRLIYHGLGPFRDALAQFREGTGERFHLLGAGLAVLPGRLHGGLLLFAETAEPFLCGYGLVLDTQFLRPRVGDGDGFVQGRMFALAVHGLAGLGWDGFVGPQVADPGSLPFKKAGVAR